MQTILNRPFLDEVRAHIEASHEPPAASAAAQPPIT